MTQKTLPFIEGKFGWAYGESNWNLGMDENLVKFSFLFDRNVDAVTASLPVAGNGNAVFLTTDNKLYFAVENVWYSSPCPKWFIFVDRSSGQHYQFNGITTVAVESNAALGTALDAVEITVAALGTAAFEDTSYFATATDLDAAEAAAISYTDSSVATALAGLKSNIETYSSASISSGTCTLNASTSSYWGVVLNQNITTLTLTGSTASKACTINAVFTQDTVGGKTVAIPASVTLSAGKTSLVSSPANSITLVKFVTVDNGASWLANVINFTTTPEFPLPPNENTTFNDEGINTALWTPSNSTLATTTGFLRSTKVTGGTLAKMSQAVTFTATNSDYILYGRVRARRDANSIATIWFLNGAKEVSLWLGSANASSASTPGAISICGTTGASTRNVASGGTGFNYDTTPLEFALQFDNKFTSLTLWLKQSDYTWKFAARVACDWFTSTTIELLNGTTDTAGAWVEFDYLSLCRPNFAVLSDSIGEGKTLFSPDRSLSLTNDSSTWMRHASPPAYRSLRNTLIVNKGVGGQSSTQILARVADVVNIPVVFLHASSNDVALSVSQGTRTSNIQNTVTAISGWGGKTILLNSSYGTQAGSDNTPTPALRDYVVTSWTSNLPTVTGVSKFLDIMLPVKDVNGFLAAANAADGIHPNITGHTLIGNYIATQ